MLELFMVTLFVLFVRIFNNSEFDSLAQAVLALKSIEVHPCGLFKAAEDPSVIDEENKVSEHS